MFPTRDQLIEHLEQHAAEDGIELRLGTRVDRIARHDGRWVVHTSAGEIRAQQLVVATGFDSEPFVPDWSGRDGFTGRLLHACEYKNPEPFKGRKVLVVGTGCSGMEIAYGLAEGGAEKVWLSARTPPNIVLRESPGRFPGDIVAVSLLHLPVRLADAVSDLGRRMDLGDLAEYGLPVPEEGIFARMDRLGVVPAVVDKEVIEAIKAGRIEVVRGVESLSSTAVELADGARIEPDVLICATGYRSGMAPLVGQLDVLYERGMPRAVGAEPAAGGLRFLGYVARPGALGHMSREAKRAAKAIARELRTAGASPHRDAVADPEDDHPGGSLLMRAR